MTFENCGITVRDLEATIAFITDLGLTVLCRRAQRQSRRQERQARDGQLATVASSSSGCVHPDAIESEPTLPNEVGTHRVAFSVDDIDEAIRVAPRGTAAARCAA